MKKKNIFWKNPIILLGFIIVFSISCQEEDIKITHNRFELVSGENQIALEESTLKDAIEFVVKDEQGNAIEGVSVVFTTSDGSVSKRNSTTNSDGKVSITWTLGANEGIQLLTAVSFESDGVTHLVGSPIEIPATSAPRSATDIDGNSYNVVVIGKQIWMKENLRVTNYPDGTEIPHVIDKTVWGNLDFNDGAFCYPNNNSAEAKTLGALYTWAAAMGKSANSSNTNPSGVQGICPTGWHLPSVAEWTEMNDYLENNGYGYEGSGDDIGKSMAETYGWYTSSTIGAVGYDLATNNKSGFSGLPSGIRGANTGAFFAMGRHAGWWSSTELDTEKVYGNEIDYNFSYSFKNNLNKKYGMSVRCIKD